MLSTMWLCRYGAVWSLWYLWHPLSGTWQGLVLKYAEVHEKLDSSRLSNRHTKSTVCTEFSSVCHAVRYWIRSSLVAGPRAPDSRMPWQTVLTTINVLCSLPPRCRTPRALCWHSPEPHTALVCSTWEDFFCCFHSVTSTHVNRMFFYCGHSKQEILDSWLIKPISLRLVFGQWYRVPQKGDREQQWLESRQCLLPERVLHVSTAARCLGSVCSSGEVHTWADVQQSAEHFCCPLCDSGWYRQILQLAACAELCILAAIQPFTLWINGTDLQLFLYRLL